jgi:hypothetical protein
MALPKDQFDRLFNQLPEQNKKREKRKKDY